MGLRQFPTTITEGFSAAITRRGPLLGTSWHDALHMSVSPSKRVLLVDDGRAERRLAVIALRNAGCLTTVADNASAALRCLPGGAFDMMICDQRLPDLMGTALLRLVARSVAPPPPMLLLSSDPSRETREAALRAGAVAVVTKPTTPQQLAELVLAHATPPRGRHVDHLLDAAHTEDFMLGAGGRVERAALAQRWLAAVGAQLATLALHVDRQNGKGWRQELHRLRGAAALVGAIRLEVATAELESAVPATSSLALLESLLETTAAALLAYAGGVAPD